MLLIDPEAPAIATYCCVFIATLALISLSNRVAPRSMWPAFAALLYIYYNLVSLSGIGGEFQKTHEETTALVVMMAWAICMYSLHPKSWGRVMTMAMVSVTVASAILTQAIAVIFAVLFGWYALLALIKKQFRQMWHYGVLACVAGGITLSIFALNYFVTGLATDQAINLTWRYADLERLNHWGVIPNVIIVAWIRDNYQNLVTSWGWNDIRQAFNFMRLDLFWISTLIALLASMRLLKIAKHYRYDETKRDAFKIFINISLILGIFSFISIFAGRSQPVSFYRFSSFFAPLFILFCVACCGFLNQFEGGLKRFRLVSHFAFPILLMVAIVFSWGNWFEQAKQVTKPALKFALGEYSLADAYSHQHIGLPFGGINPGTFEAVKHVPPGSRVWSTNTDSYCMTPGCRVESVVSFKLSSNLNEILNGSPEEAKKILQSEGLNYFIFSTDSRLLDLLPYSRLFNPEVMNKHFAVKWTDRQTYLLTWLKPGDKPVDATFLKAYTARFREPESNWFKFSKVVPKLNAAMQLIANQPHPWRSIQLPFQDPSKRTGIQVIEASYGNSCKFKRVPAPHVNTVQTGNATGIVQEICNGKEYCQFKVDQALFGDPANGCRKDFRVSYMCPTIPNQVMYASTLGDAYGKQIKMGCRKTSGIHIVRATFGDNCRLKLYPFRIYRVGKGNVSNDIRDKCEGKEYCKVMVNIRKLGNPAKGCKKDFNLSYFCSGDERSRSISLKSESLIQPVFVSC